MSMPPSSNTPRDPEELRQLFQRLQNWGRWGADDQRGTLNHIDAEVRLTAIRGVRQGRSYPFGQVIRPVGASSVARTRDVTLEVERSVTVRDEFTIAPHGFATTHIDALGHCFFDGFAYNGRPRDTVVNGGVLSYGDIAALQDGILTRGVLLDVTAGTDHLDPGAAITPDDLNEAAESAGVAVRAGDAVFVRSGRGLPGGDPEDGGARTGLRIDCLEWMHDRDVAVFGGDCVDVAPSPYPGYPDHLHQVALAGMGLVMLDLPDMEVLRHAVDREGIHEFLLTAAPLAIVGATGSPVNPIATF